MLIYYHWVWYVLTQLFVSPFFVIFFTHVEIISRCKTFYEKVDFILKNLVQQNMISDEGGRGDSNFFSSDKVGVG